jgi:nitrogen fixation NifU-like protein
VNDLRELYQEVLLDHYRHPRNFGALTGANRKVEGHNPLCGDRITLYVDVDGERVKELSFEGSGCAISTASASLLTEAVKGKTRAEVEALYHRFHGLVTDDQSEGDPSIDLGKLEIFAGVREYPMRVKCATLSWHALRSALEGGGTVSTE